MTALVKIPNVALKDDLVLLAGKNDVGRNAKQGRQRRDLGLRCLRRQTTQMQHTARLRRLLGQSHLTPNVNHYTRNITTVTAVTPSAYDLVLKSNKREIP